MPSSTIIIAYDNNSKERALKSAKKLKEFKLIREVNYDNIGCFELKKEI